MEATFLSKVCDIVIFSTRCYEIKFQRFTSIQINLIRKKLGKKS